MSSNEVGGEKVEKPVQKIVTLINSDEEKMVADLEAIKMSNVIKTMIKNIPEEKLLKVDIPVGDVEIGIMKKVIEWCNHHLNNPPPLDNKDDSIEKKIEGIPQWDVKFLKENSDMVFDLLMAANFLDISGLLNSCCKTVANMLKGKTPEQIREQFGIINDYTKEEEEEIRSENQWCELV